MSNENQWLGPLGAQASAPNASTHADMSSAMRHADAQPAAPTRGYWSIEIPESAVNSMYWKGTDAARFFGLWEPTSGEIRKLVKADADFTNAAQNFVGALGVPGPDGKVLRKPDGSPDLRPVTNSTADVLPWWSLLPSKAQTLVTSMFVEMIMPTEAEGKSMRSSKQWVGG